MLCSVWTAGRHIVNQREQLPPGEPGEELTGGSAAWKQPGEAWRSYRKLQPGNNLEKELTGGSAAWKQPGEAWRSYRKLQPGNNLEKELT
ncbi:hypothetical protein JOQ06_006445, partial [Pogonophryne albipinna]